jgi:hypothetical protein
MKPNFNAFSNQLLKGLIIVFLFSGAFTLTTYAQVNLTASVGPTSGSFTTLNSAFASINIGTHKGVITITIVNNTTEPATPTPLLQSSGLSSYTSISIMPSGGNWTIGGAAAPTAGRGLIELNGADNVTIDGDDAGTAGSRNLTFQQNTSSNSNVSVVRFASSTSSDGASFNTLKNCNIIGSRISVGSSTTNYGVYSGTAGVAAASISGQSDNNDNLTIENDSIARCYWGVYCAGTAANYMDNLIIRNNVIGSAISGNGVANRGIYIQNTQAVTTPGATIAIVEGNDIQLTAATGGAGTCMGMEIANGNAGALVRRNNLHDIQNPTLGSGAHGINISGATQNASVTIYNNFIRDISNIAFGTALGGSTAVYGIALSAGAANLKVYYNSISINAPNTINTTESTCAFAVISAAAGVTNLDVRNNIFSNTQTAPGGADKRYAIYLAGTIAAIGSINNNVYYSSGTGAGSFILGNFNGVDKATLSAWQASTGQDGSSGFVNPGFTSTTDLHIPPAASQLESGAVAIAGITTDYDGQARPGPAGSVNGGGTLPDIGADEFDGIPSDLTPPVISYSVLGPTCSTSDRTITATITDASGVPVAGALQPRIYFRKNAGSYFSSQGILSSGSATSGTWTFTITVAAMGGVTVGDQVFYFVIAQDIATTPNISSNPSGVTAANVNTVSSPPPSPNSFLVQGTLGGTFNVGVSQPYTTLTSAVNAYNGSCLTGPVTFILTDASYPSETFPVTITSNAFASATNTLTIKPAAGNAVTISGTSSAAVIKINGGDYVTIDGLNTAGSSLAFINNDASATSNVIWVGSAGTSDGSTNDAIKNCSLKGNASTTTFAGVFAGSGTTVGAAGTAEASNNLLTVQGCSFTKMKYGIYANGNAGISDASWLFTGNTMGSTLTSDKLSASAIILFNAQNFTVSNNSINGVVSASITTASGIGVFGNIAGGNIFNNRISDIKNTNNSAAQGSNGMQISASNTGANLSVYNNFIWDVASFGSNSTSATSNGWGILFTGGGGYNIYFNTIYLSTDQTFTTGITAAINITNGVNTTNAINLRNNILANTQTVGAQRYAIICNGAFGATTFTDINFNDYFYSGPNLGSLSGAQSNLAAWQGATGKDASSQSVNPFFVSTSNLHLITSSSTLDNSGVSIAGITTDIDGDVRPATPDMGADEFTFANNNCTGTPTAGTIPSSFTLCPAQTIVLNVTGYTQGVLGITFQWEESDDNGVSDPWANAVGGSGSTTIAYTTPGSLNTIYYRCKVTCTSSGLFAYTNVCTIGVTPFTIPEDFSSVTFPPGCWTRNDATYIFRSGVSAYGSGSGSAEFNFYSATYQANLDLTTPVFAPFPAGYVLYFDHAYATYSGEIDSLVILYSTNGGGSYSTLIVYQGGTSGPLNTGGTVGSLTQFVPAAGQWASKIVTLPAGTNRIIFRGKGNFGNNLYIDNINFLPPGTCDTPVPSASNIGTTSADISWTCAGCTGTYDLDYGSAGHVAGTGTIVAGVTSTYSLNPPLTPNASYTVYVRQNCGVYGYSSWSAAVNFTTACAAPVPVASTNTPLCNGHDINLMAVNNAAGQAAGNTYAWTGPAGFASSHQDTTITSGTAANNGTYTVTVTNQYSCTASASVNVTVNPNPSVSATSNAPFCSATQNLNLISNSATATLYAWTGPGGYSSSAANPSITNAPNTASGTYKVVATDVNGCKDSATTPVTIYALPNVSITVIGSTNICTGQTSSDLQGTGALSYLWSTSETTSLITITSSGSYQVTGTDGNGCMNNQVQVITQSAPPAQPVVTPSGTIELCTDGITVTPVTLTCTNYSTGLLWSTNQTTQSISVDYEDNFSVSFSDANGCFSTSNPVLTVIDNILPAISCPADISQCNPVVTWTNTATDNCGVVSTNCTPASGSTFSTGTTAVNCTATDGNGNVASCSFNVTVSTPSTAATSATSNAGNGQVCLGGSVTLTANGGSLGTGGSWVWYEGGCASGVSIGSGASITITPASNGTHQYFVRAEGACAPTSCQGVTVNVISAPPVGTVSFTTAITDGCVGAPSAVFSVTPVAGAAFYRWSSGQAGARFNGQPGPFETSAPTVNVTFVSLPAAGSSGWSLCVFGGNACGNSNTVCSWVRATVSAPSFISGSVIGCPGAVANSYTAGGVAGAVSYQWSATGGIVINSNGTQAITVNFPAGFVSGTLSVHGQTSCGYNGPNKSITITSTPSIPGAITGSSYPCPNASSTYSIAAVPGAVNYTWTTTVPGAVVTGTGTSCSIAFPASIPGGSLVSVVANSSCPTSGPARSKSIANGIPNVPAIINGPASGQCGETGVSYSITPVPLATGYNWTSSCGTIVGPANLSGVTVDWPASFNTCVLSVTASNSCGTSIARTLAVKAAPAQPGTIAAGPSTWCSGQFVSFTITGSAGATAYNWTCSNGNIISGQGTSSLGVIWGSGAGNVTVSASNGCGVSPVRSQTFASSCRESQLNIAAGSFKAEIYPNPASLRATVKFNSNSASDYKLVMRDIIGQVVLTTGVAATVGVNIVGLDLHLLSKGLYLLQVSSAENSSQVTVIIE